MKLFTLILVLIVLLLGISFAILNANDVVIHYYFGHATMALSLLLAITLIIGVFIGLIASLLMFIKSKAKQHHLRKQLETAQKEIANLRKMPLEDKH